MIEVKNLVKRYGDHTAVDHLSFTVDDGQVYGFLGPNGAGKSTTMNIMTGYLGATEGEVLINGMNILEEPEEAKKCIGYLPELPPLYTDMKVEEYLRFCAELKQIPKKARAAAVEEAIEKTKLTDMRGRLIRNLSKGYKQRVGLAQAILGMPEIIILDEPTVGLDPMQIIEMRELIKSLAQGHTVILSSHIMQEITAVCDRVMIIAHGKLVANDTPDELEKRFTGGTMIDMEVKGSEDAVLAVLKGFSGIQEKTVTEEDGICKVTLNMEGGEDIREELGFAFADARLAVLTIKATEISLEDVFLELTSDVSGDEETVQMQAEPEESVSEEEVEQDAGNI